MRIIAFSVLIKRETENGTKYSSDTLIDNMGNKTIEQCIKVAEDFCRDLENKFNCICEVSGFSIKEF